MCNTYDKERVHYLAPIQYAMNKYTYIKYEINGSPRVYLQVKESMSLGLSIFPTSTVLGYAPLAVSSHYPTTLRSTCLLSTTVPQSIAGVYTAW